MRSGSCPARLGVIYSVSAERAEGRRDHLFLVKVEHPGDFLEVAMTLLKWLRIYNQMVMAL